MMNESVHSIMNKDLVTIDPDKSLYDVKQLFLDKRIHHLPIVSEGKLVGLVTTYDLLKTEIDPSEYSHIPVSQIMTTKFLKIGPDDKIGTAAELFLDKRFHALPVVQDGVLLGLVTSFDILKYEFRKEYPVPILFKEILEQGLRVAI